MSGTINGLRIGVVTNLGDPTNSARVQVRFPWLEGGESSGSSELSVWARVAVASAGKDRGLFLLPEVGDEVIVGFEAGDIEFPYVLGSLWNGQDTPPEKIENGKNDHRSLTSRSGHVVRLDDTEGKERIEIIGKGATTKIVFDCSAESISVEASGDVSITGKNITIAAENETVIKGAKVKIN